MAAHCLGSGSGIGGGAFLTLPALIWAGRRTRRARRTEALRWAITAAGAAMTAAFFAA